MPSAALPQWIRPQLTRLVDAAPDGEEWLHEIKYDGYRMLPFVEIIDRHQAAPLPEGLAEGGLCLDALGLGVALAKPTLMSLAQNGTRPQRIRVTHGSTKSNMTAAACTPASMAARRLPANVR